MSYQEVDIDFNHWLVMTSDGIKTRWETNKYPNIFKYDPGVLAAVIYKDYGRRTDDTSVLIAKIN